jgi:arylsulfatase A
MRCQITRCLLLLGTLLMVSASPAVAAEARPPRPNFVFILIDDMGWKDVGCMGSTFFKTPNVDRLAASGMRFTQGYAACPVCSPTRASIVTGRYPARLHLTDWLPGRGDRPSQKLLRPKIRQALPLEEITLAEALKPAGYVSAAIGKWHLGGEGHLPQNQGFDVNVAGTRAGSPTGGYFNFKSPSLTLHKGEYLTDRLTEEAEKFIEQNREKPFLLYLAHYAVHIPLQAKKDLVEKYRAIAKTGQPQHNPVYAAMIESVDDSVGRVLKKLDDLKLADRTVVVFTSDNGGLSVKEGPNTPSTSNGPLRGGKGYLYEGGTRVPFIVRAPGVSRAGTVCDVPVSSIDFYPTFLELAGIKPDPKKPVDGVSLVPLLKGGKELKRDALYWHYPHYSNQGGRPGSSVRQGDYKLIEFFEDGKLELYNLKDDPAEKHNLSEKLPEKTGELHAMLKGWRKSMDAQMMTPNPAYRAPAKK